MSISDSEKRRIASAAYYQANKDKWKNPDGSWIQAPNEVRNERARKRYENPVQREKHLVNMRLRRDAKRVEGKCPLCLKHRQLVREHCHKTGKDRGWVCHACNLVMGHAYDNPGMLRRAAAYLEGKMTPTS